MQIFRKTAAIVLAGVCMLLAAIPALGAEAPEGITPDVTGKTLEELM